MRRAQAYVPPDTAILRWVAPALLAALWLGSGETARQILPPLSLLAPLLYQTVRGIRAVDPALVETGRSHDLSGWPLYRHVLLPGALPFILTGLRQGLELLWLTLIALELFATPSGLGRLPSLDNSPPGAAALLLGLALFAVLSLASGALVSLLERWLLRWRPR
ncbi:ABC transporter permease [Achromobacter sp.]|uniref:ABC transporter permease n=1 Tax=Achromobacter sp. TaxID=134375 RepID=UPI002F94738F